MKTKCFVLLLIAFFISNYLFAQSYSVWFNSPTNNSTVSGSVIDNTKSSVSISFSWSGQKANQQNKWKFKVIKDILTGGGETYAETWVYEDTPYCNLPGDILAQNWYLIQMYEEDYITQALTQRAQTSHITVWVQQTIYVANNFSSGNVTVNTSTYSSGSSFNLSLNQSLNLAAIDNQTDSQGYTRVWNTSGTNNSDWRVNNINKTYSSSYTYYATSYENGVTITANLRKVCNISFNGPVYAGGSYYNSTPVPAIEGNPIQVTAQGYTSLDYIEMGFSSWSDANSQNPRSFTVYSNTNYGINYVGLKPNNGYKNMQFTGNVGQNIHFTWSEHPNSSVTKYQIWRTVKNVSGPTLLTELNRGTTSFTDNQYVYTDGYTDNLLSYDVRAYYSPASSYADNDYVAVFGREGAEIDNNFSEKNTRSLMIPTDYSIGNYPNPFNPTTTINYQLPENGFVTIKVYDLLGKEVATLVNESKSAGYHRANFDASKLTSGVYIYTIIANNFIQSKKMLLMK